MTKLKIFASRKLSRVGKLSLPKPVESYSGIDPFSILKYFQLYIIYPIPFKSASRKLDLSKTKI